MRQMVFFYVVLTAYERAVEEGKEEGKLEGKREGEHTAKLETSKRMWERRFSLQEISENTGLSEVQLMENGILV
jgi:predicted transposase/invertase (TIGR01784 family)